jgi:hypothetical protein
MDKYVDIGSLAIITVTFVLFAIALLVKGFTHDLFLEAGIFLVSVKLIVMAYKNNIGGKKIAKELHVIKQLLEKSED